jgi:integrase
MQRSLTDRFLESLKAPKAGRHEVADTQAPGLEIRVTPDGRKSWSVRYSPKGMGRRRATIGVYPGMKLADARAETYEIAAAAKRGIDKPSADQRAKEEVERAAGSPKTVKELTARYIADYAKANQRRWKLTERMFQMHVDPEIGAISLGMLRRADIVALLDDLQNKKGLAAQVNRVRSQLVAMLNWAVEREWLPANPAAGVKKRKGVEAPRARVLSDDELRKVWNAADAIGYPGGAFIKALILSGQRRDEVRCMPWSELIEADAAWLLPGSRNKGKRDHLVPLSKDLRALIEASEKVSSFVFSTDGKKPYSGQKRLKEILDRKSGVTGWTLHDVRRTVSTRMSELGIPRDVVRRLLNHAKPGLDRVYDAHEYREDKARALEAWAQRLALIIAGEKAVNVVALQRVG